MHRYTVCTVCDIQSYENKMQTFDIFFYATLAYIRHFISAGCYDNDPWYLVTNLRGFIFLNAPLDLLLGTSYRPSFSSCDGGSPTVNKLYLPGLEHDPPLIESVSSTTEPWMLYTIVF
jgi:hypothetical protein